MPQQILELSYDYRPDLVSGLEDASKVMILAYVTKDLGHHYDVRIPGKQEHKLRLTINTPENLDQPFIDADAGVCIRAWAAGLNDDGQKVMKQAGGTFFRMSELLSSTRKQIGARYMIIPNLENPVTNTVPQKGTIALVVEALPQLANAVRPVGPHDYVPENYGKYQQILMQYQQLVRLPYTELKPTFPNATGLCMPIVSSGIAKLPGALFAYPRSEPATEEWHFNAYVSAARRAYPFLESKQETIDFLTHHRLTETETMNILMLSHTAVVANGTCYVGDGAYVKTDRELKISGPMPGVGFQQLLAANPPTKLEKGGDICGTCRTGIKHIGEILRTNNAEYRGMEDFAVGVCRMMKNVKDWGCLGAIDCEDGGMDAMIQAMDLSYAQFNNPIMQRAQEVQKNYEPLQSLEYVNGRELADAARTNRLGGHLKSAYSTRDYEVQMQERGSSARPVFEGVSTRLDNAPKDYLATPVIDGEGTGLMMPVPNDAQATVMTKNHEYMKIFTEANAESMRGVRFMMPHYKTQKSRFYNTINSYVPLRLADQGFPAIEHIATKTTPQGTTIGIDYLDFINGSKTNSAFVAGRMTDEQVPYMQHLLKFLAPVPAYKAAPDRPDSHPLLDRLVNIASQQGRRQARPEETEYYQVYFREHEVREQAVQVLMNQVTSKSRVFKVSYHFENFGEDLSSWCVQFHLSP